MSSEQEFREPVDENWLIFSGVVIGMALLCAVLIILMSTIRSNHREDEISQRGKFVACQAVENEIARTVCINGWAR